MSGTSVAVADIATWTSRSLNKRTSGQLQRLMTSIQATLPAADAASRGDRVGKVFIKSELIAALLARRDAVVAQHGGGQSAASAAAAAAGFSKLDIVHYRADESARWQPAVITEIGHLGAAPIFAVRMRDASGSNVDISGVSSSQLRAPPTGRLVEAVHADDEEFASGDLVKLRSDAGPAGNIGVVLEVKAGEAKPYFVRMGGASVTTAYASNELVAPAQGNDEQPPDPGRGPSPGFLRELGIGEQGAPGQHTREGHEATQDIEVPGAAGANTSPPGHAATWRQLGAPADWLERLDRLDPASLSNFRHGSGMLPDLARGAGEGNGASTIIANRPIRTEEVWYVADFILRLLHIEPAVQTNTIIRCADPVSTVEYVSGATRLRQCAMDNQRWPNDDGYLDVYIPRITGWSAHYTWAAINAYDRAFRRAMHAARPGASWRVLDVALHTACMLDDPSARLHTGGGGFVGAPRAPRAPGGGKQQPTLRDVPWANKYLKHTEHAGGRLCFHEQRHGSCGRAGKGCAFTHNHCGMCGQAGHVARACPSGAPPQ